MMDKKKLIKIVENFKDKKIGVIGDVMLDKFIWGKTDRISPEAPVPVVLIKKESYMSGGAGNTAGNMASLEAKVFIVGVIGDDEAGGQLLKELKKQKVNTSGTLKDKKRVTTQKIRIIAKNQHIVRVDREDNKKINNKQEDKLFSFVTKHISEWDGLVISDYDKGVITQKLAQKIRILAKKYNKPMVVDMKPNNISFFKNVSLLTPNYDEAKIISGKTEIEDMGRYIQQKTKSDVLITQGSKGMTLFSGDISRHFPAESREVFDMAGAGDTVIACVALSLVSGATLEESAFIANCAAGIVVSKFGISTVSPSEIEEYVKNNKICH